MPTNQKLSTYSVSGRRSFVDFNGFSQVKFVDHVMCLAAAEVNHIVSTSVKPNILMCFCHPSSLLSLVSLFESRQVTVVKGQQWPCDKASYHHAFYAEYRILSGHGNMLLRCGQFGSVWHHPSFIRFGRQP